MIPVSYEPNTQMCFLKVLMLLRIPAAFYHCSSIHLPWQTLPLTSMFSSYPDFCRKGRSGSAIGKDGVGRADTISAFAQNKWLNFHCQHTSLTLTPGLLWINKDYGLKLAGICPETNAPQPVLHQPLNPLELIQIWDSIYDLQWDTTSHGCQPGYKYSDMVYNAKHYLTSYLGMPGKAVPG